MSKPINWEIEIFYRGRPLSDYADAVREECTMAVAQLECISGGMFGTRYNEAIADAIATIRALKGDKP